MHSTSPIHKPPVRKGYGRLFVVATPLGNPDDITLRAISVLSQVDIVAAEDTREVGKLLQRHQIKAKLISCHDHNETARAQLLVEKLKDGVSVALVSDAGTPCISDPGYRVVKAAAEQNLPIVPIPGACAVTTALSVSGLATDSFVFIGFPQKKSAALTNQLESLSEDSRTIVFYESPKRVLRLLGELIRVWGDRYGVLARELTKPHEEFLRGSLSNIRDELEARPQVKGECTLIVEGCKPLALSPEEIREIIGEALTQSVETPSNLARSLAKRLGVPKRAVYDEILALKNSRHEK